MFHVKHPAQLSSHQEQDGFLWIGRSAVSVHLSRLRRALAAFRSPSLDKNAETRLWPRRPNRACRGGETRLPSDIQLAGKGAPRLCMRLPPITQRVAADS